MKETNIESVDVANGEYERYQALGGIINEGDYASALSRVPEKVKEFTDMREILITQAQAGNIVTQAQQEDLRRLSIQMTPIKIMADRAGILLESDEALEKIVGTEFGAAAKLAKDPRAALFGILRGDTNTSGAEYHHSQMDDQNLFAEALRMSGDEDSLKKIAEAYSNVSFEHGKE